MSCFTRGDTTNNNDRELFGRFEEKLNNMHEDIIEIKTGMKDLEKKTNKVILDTELNTQWIKQHEALHRGYFAKAIAVLGVVTGLLTLGWHMLMDLVRGLIR